MWYDAYMIKVLEKAIEKVKALPEERQAYAAAVLEDIAAAAGEVFQIPEEHRDAVFEGLAQAKRGELATEEEMAALWKKCGL